MCPKQFSYDFNEKQSKTNQKQQKHPMKPGRDPRL